MQNDKWKITLRRDDTCNWFRICDSLFCFPQSVASGERFQEGPGLSVMAHEGPGASGRVMKVHQAITYGTTVCGMEQEGGGLKHGMPRQVTGELRGGKMITEGDEGCMTVTEGA